MIEIKYSEKAVKQIKLIAKGNRKSAELILDTIEKYVENPKGKFDIKHLKGKLAEFKRLRVGNYRIIFDVIENVLYVYEIKHRKEVYHD